MKFNLPFNSNVTVRFFERVETVDTTYDIADVGLQYSNGSIDSVAVGGNFSTLKESLRSEEEKKAEKKAARKAKRAAKRSADNSAELPKEPVVAE